MRSHVYIPVIGEITAQTFKEYADLAIIGGVFPRARVEGDPLPVLICSPGGDISYTFAMLDDIDYWKRTTFATGICQSAAAILATAGEGKRIATMDALFSFHRPEPKSEGGEISDLDYYLHSLRVARLAARLKVERIEIEDMFDGKFISSIRAKELGLIDEVISTEVLNGNLSGLPRSESGIDCEQKCNTFGNYRFDPDRGA
jgi:ATP-dependent protease ClpP protease subunit